MYSVLVVDDEFMIKRSLTKMIEHDHFRFKVVGEAEDGKEALGMVEILKPDILVTDVYMPVMDGLDLIAAAKEKHGSVEAIIISGYDEFAYAQKAVQFGVHDYILKPIRPEVLHGTLDRVFAKIEGRKRRFEKHGEWVSFYRETAQKLVELMRYFDEGRIINELKNIHHAILTKEKDLIPYPLKNMYQDLISAINERLTKKYGCSGIAFVENDVAPEADQLYKQMQTAVLIVLSELRHKKNLKVNLKIHKALELINQRFTESLSLEDVAQAVGLTPTYFSSSFGESVGMSFTRYVTQLRMNKAKMLLKDPHLKTYEIADAIGYQDYPHFSRAFKKQTGLSPAEFRKQLAKGI